MNQRFSDPKYIQIDSLKQYFPTVKEITRDTIYEITLLTPKRQNLQLRITLAPDFPRTTPILTISPPVLHRFVDNQQHINILPIAHENLQRWNVNSSLGKVVYEIVQKFMQEPPQILNSSLPSMNNYPPSLNNPPSNSLPSTINPTMMNPSTNSFISTQNILSNENNTLHTPLPVIPSSFPEIESKSLTELTQLMNDEFEFQKFFESLSTVQTMKKVRDDLRVSNEELAKKKFFQRSRN
jgi:ubiquitin-protein ligase